MTDKTTIRARAAELALEFRQSHLEPFAGERLPAARWAQFSSRVLQVLDDDAARAVTP